MTTQSNEAAEIVGEHTPGPWLVSGEQFVGSEGKWIASTMGVRGQEGAANARLIAAAPELLADLEFAVKLLRPFGGTAQIQRMEATIAKAKGASA